MKDSSCVFTICDHRSVFCPPDSLLSPKLNSDHSKKADISNSSCSSGSASSEDELDSVSQQEFKPASLYDNKNFKMPSILSLSQFTKLNTMCGTLSMSILLLNLNFKSFVYFL